VAEELFAGAVLAQAQARVDAAELPSALVELHTRGKQWPRPVQELRSEAGFIDH